MEYVENKGQWDSRVKYKSDMGASAFFLEQQGYKVLLYSKEDLEKIATSYSGHTHPVQGKVSSVHIDNSSAVHNNNAPLQKIILHSFAYEVNFAGASFNAKITPDKALQTYNNYYIGNNKSKWASHCKLYGAVTYENIYKGIDVRYYSGTGNIKYDFIVHPGADVDNIALEFNGVEGLSVKKGNLIVKTSLGDISELKPYAYLLDANGKKEVDAKYIIKGNTVRFKVSSISKNATLIIDPTLIFSSFSGSRSDNWGYTATYDHNGNFYAAGIAFGTGYPTTTGAIQTTFGGGMNESGLSPYDIALIKLSSDGSQLLYGTYIGGSSGNEQPHSLIADNQNNLIIAGRTNS
jgi:hypothetical protein